MSAMFGRTGAGLQRAVVAAVIVACVVLLGLDGWWTWQARGAALSVDESELKNLARSVAQHAHDTLKIADTALLSLRLRLTEDGITPEALRRLRQMMEKQVASRPMLAGLYFCRADGTVAADSLIGSHALDVPAAMESLWHYRSAVSTDLHLGSPIKEAASGEWLLPLSRRVDGPDGQFAGTVLATISIRRLQEHYHAFDLGRGGNIALLLRDGRMVAREPASDGAIGTVVQPERMSRSLAVQGESGMVHYSSAIDGVVRTGSFRTVADFPLVVVVGHENGAVLQEWRDTAVAHSAVSLSASTILLGLGLYLGGCIRRQSEAERRYRLLADNSSDAIVCIGPNGKRLYASPSFQALTGWSLEESLRFDWGAIIHPEEREHMVGLYARLRACGGTETCCYRYLCRDGSHLWVEARFCLVGGDDPTDALFIANIRDITERRAAEERVAALNRELARQAATDGLTGLANRRRFDERLQHDWERASRDRHPLSLLLLDVDRFKAFNDRYGHQSGDACLRSVCAAVAGTIRRTGDLAARYGGEEIAVLLPGCDAIGAADRAETVRAAVQALGVLHEDGAGCGVVTVSVGVATMLLPGAPDEGFERLIALADAALYEAKRRGRNRVAMIDPRIDQTSGAAAARPFAPAKAE